MTDVQTLSIESNLNNPNEVNHMFDHLENPMDTLATHLLAHYGIPAKVSTTESPWEVPSNYPQTGSGPRHLHTPFPTAAAWVLRTVTREGVSERKARKRLKVMFSKGDIELIAFGTYVPHDTHNAKGVVSFDLIPTELQTTETAIALDDCHLSIGHAPSHLNVNDGHGVISFTGALKIVVAELMQRFPNISVDSAVARARQRLQGVTHVQHFSLTHRGGTKGLLHIVEDALMHRRFSTSFDILIDSENVKSEVSMHEDLALFKAYLRRPVDNPKLTAISEINEIGIGFETRTSIGAPRMAAISAELLERTIKDLGVALERDTERALPRLPWDEAERSDYALEAEQGVAMRWTGHLYTRTKGRLPSTIGHTLDYGRIRRTQAIISAIGAYFVGDGSYYNTRTPEDGYIKPVIRNKQVIGWAMSANTLKEHSLSFDTMDADGDYAVVSVRLDTSDPLNPYRAHVVRLPSSVGGGAILKLTGKDYDFLTRTRGLIPAEITGDLPYTHFQTEGVYTLFPIPDDVSEPNSGAMASLGAIYNVAMVLKETGWITDRVSDTYREGMAALGLTIPDVDGIRFNISEHVIDPSGDKSKMLDELERVLWRHISRGEKIDECFRSRVNATVRTLKEKHHRAMQNPQIAANVNSCFRPCEGEHADYNATIATKQQEAAKFEKNLEMLSNGPLSTLTQPSSPELIAAMNELTTRINAIWKVKFDDDRSIPGETPFDERRDLEQAHFADAKRAEMQAVDELFHSLTIEPGAFAHALIQRAALDNRRYNERRRATMLNHLYTWARHTEAGEREQEAFLETHEPAVPTVLARINNVHFDLLKHGLEYRIRRTKDGKHVLTGDYCQGILPIADVVAGGEEALGRKLAYRGIAADGQTHVFEAKNILKTS